MESENELISGASRQVWFDGRTISLERQDLWGLVNNSALHRVVVTVAQRRSGHFPLKTEFVTEVSEPSDLLGLDPGEVVCSLDESLLAAARAGGFSTCLCLAVDSREALEQAWQKASAYDYAVVQFDLPTNIPLELILARMAGRRTRIIKRETTFEGMEVAFGVMEQGSDGVLVVTEDPAEIQKVSRYVARAQDGQLQLQPLVVTGLRHVGMGMRACVDSTGLMTREEGMLIGSTSSGGILVCSETHFLPYMNLRPFRVNAGAVHSYIWGPDGAAEYLTDLSAGSRVLCVDVAGHTRALTVGRVKVEARPLLLIRGEAEAHRLNVIVQDDWHIRLMGADGQPKNATEIRPGDELLCHVCRPGRHVGIPVTETILEE